MAKKFAELRERMIPDAFAVREAVSSEDPLQGRTWLQRKKCPMTGTRVGHSPKCFAIYRVAANTCPVGRRSPGQQHSPQGPSRTTTCNRERCSNAGED